MPTHTPAPRRPQPRKNMMGCTLPPGAQAIVDELVGTFIGASRSEVLRFIIQSWITDHHTAIKHMCEEATLAAVRGERREPECSNHPLMRRADCGCGAAVRGER